MTNQEGDFLASFASSFPDPNCWPSVGENINSVNNDRDICQEDDIVYTTDLTHTKLSRQIPIQQVSASHHSPFSF